MKNNKTVLEWLQEQFPDKRSLDIKEKYYDLLSDDLSPEEKVNATNTLLSSPVDSIYMGEVVSLLLELRKENK